MRKLILICTLLSVAFGAAAQNDTTRYTMVNGYGFTYNRLKTKAAMVMPADTVANKLPGSIVILNDTLYIRTNVRWQAVSAGAAGLPAGGTIGQILAKDSDTSYDVSWIDNYTEDVRETVKAATAISKGQAVYVSGADGTNVIVSKASNNTEMTSSKTLGLLYQDLAQNGIGYVIISGRLSGLNTLGATAGDPVWLGTNGNLLYGIANKPVAPAHMVYIGVVTRVNANNGEIFVHVQNGFELNELHDVSIVNKQNGQGIVYDSATSLWKNRWVLTDTTTLSNRINLKVNIADTSAMLTPYLRKADTATLSNRINLKVNISDTASMLSPYYRTATANAALATKVNISDTSTMLTPYVRAAGYGLTKSGQTLTVDTLNIATRAWRQKGLDSLAALEVSGSGTAGYVPKFTTASTIGNSQIFENGIRIGIGTQNPAARLDIRGSGLQDLYFISTTGSNQENSIQSYFNNGGGWSDLSTKSQNLLFYTGPSGGPTTERLRITSGGDVGISQPSLLWTATNRRLLELNGTSQSLIGLNVNSLKAGYIWQNGNDMTIAVENAGYLQFGTNGSSDRMRIFSTGRIGINTTTDAGYQFDVNGDGRFQGTLYTRAGTAVGIQMASTSAIRNTGTQYFDYGTGGSGDFYFRGGSGFSNVLTLMNGGNVGIGSTNPLTKLHITSGDAYIASLNTTVTTADTSFLGLGNFSSYQPGTSGVSIASYHNLGATFATDMGLYTHSGSAMGERLRITAAGNVGIATDAPSERLDVNGRIRARTIDSTASAMNVLYADATGVIKKASATAFPGGSGTLNYIPKWTAANTLGNSQIFDNGGGVGIGTTSPGQKLEIYDGALLINRPSLANDASHTMYRTQVGTDATLGALYFTMNARPSATGTSRYVEMFAGDNVGYRNIIFPYANVGIGGSPLDKLTVINDANNTTTARVRNSDVGSSAYAMMAVNASGNSWGFRMGSTAANSNALDIVSDALGTPTSRMRIFTNGRVGINTTTDAGYIFDANGSLRNTADAALATGSGNVFVGSTTAAISNGLKYIYNEVGNASGIGPELILHNTAAADAASMAVSFTGVRSGAGVSTQIRSTRRGILTFLTQDLPSATPNTPTERMRIDALGNVGVGTQSAFGRFNVASAVGIVGINAGTSSSPERGNLYYDTDGTGWKFNIGKYQSSTFTPQMTFQDNGNIGIGVQSVEAPLHIVKTGGSTNTINVGLVVDYEATAAEAVGAGTAIQFRGKSGGGNIANYNQAQIATNNTGTNNTHGLSFYYKPNAGAQLTEGFRLHGSGAVAINTQSPTGKLHVNGDQQDALQNVVRFSANNASGQTKALDFQINAGSNLATFNTAYSGTAMALSFAMAGTEAARIHANGRVGINTGSTDAGYQLDVNGNTRVTGKIDVTANASIGHNIIRSGTSDIAAQIFNSNGWLLYGAESANGGAIFTGSTPYAAVLGSGYNRPLQLATNNTVRMEIDSVGLVGINTVTPTERLDVNGRVRIRTVDSTATATNMLYVDNNGVVKKTAVPGSNVSYVTSTNTVASGWTFAKDSARNLNHNFINVVLDNTTNEGTATLQMAIYQATSSFTTGQWVNVASLSSAYTPKTTIVFELPGYVSGTTYYTSGNVQFSGASEYSGTKVVRIDPSGNVDVRIGTVSASATAGGTNYVLIPILVTYALYNIPQ